jgi:NADH:ubiquinone oxidoreductase subunit 2 (subunit N)
VGTTYSAVVTFSVLSNLADLSALAINRGTLAPAFAAATTSYTASVPAGTSSITLSLATPQGRFYDAPALAALFLIFGLAAIGLPGTLSFVADDLIVSGSLDEQLHAGLLVIASTVLSGIAVMRGWFFIFGGPTAVDGPRHTILARERFALTALLVPLFAFGLWPGPLVATLERAAEQLLGVTADGEPLSFKGRLGILPTCPWPTSVGWHEPGRPGLAFGVAPCPVASAPGFLVDGNRSLP